MLSLIVGIIAYYVKYKDEIVELKHYDYSEQDSMFVNSDNDQKRVDYEQELYDFSDNELESILTKIDINTADLKELILLPGVGKKTAQKIIDYRIEHGKFKEKNELLNISGIGEKKFQKIKEFLIIE